MGGIAGRSRTGLSLRRRDHNQRQRCALGSSPTSQLDMNHRAAGLQRAQHAIYHCRHSRIVAGPCDTRSQGGATLYARPVGAAEIGWLRRGVARVRLKWNAVADRERVVELLSPISTVADNRDGDPRAIRNRRRLPETRHVDEIA